MMSTHAEPALAHSSSTQRPAAPDPRSEHPASPADRAAHNSDGLDRLGLALADPTRRAVLVRLLDDSQCPSDLAEYVGTSRSNLSNHLACLRGCGLIRAQRRGRHLHYELVSAQLADALRGLLAVAVTLEPSDEHPARPPTDRS